MSTEAAHSTARRARGAVRLLSDERLARRAARGDEGALEEICVRYRQDLYRFCLTMLGHTHDAQDAVQNTLVKVVQALPGERRSISLKPWLYRIARNESVEVIRRRPAAEAESSELPAAIDIAESVEARERLRSLIEDLGDLPERQRATLMMRELGGLGFDEIAAAVDTSEGAVRQSIYEARQTLRRMEGGHAMSCEAVQRALSDADGRVARRRELRSHLRGCDDCRAFRDSMARRRSELAAISPLPAIASAALLHNVLGGGGAVTGGAAAKSAGVAGAGAGGALAKSAATVAVVAVVGVSAADRTGVVDVPLPGERDVVEQRAPAGPAGGGSPDVPLGGAAQTARRPRGEEPGKGGGSRLNSRNSSVSGRAEGPGAMAPGHSADRGEGGGTRNSGGPAPAGHAQGRHGQKGPPEGMPAASQRGQKTSAARKSPKARGVPGGGKAPKGTQRASEAVKPPSAGSKQLAPPPRKPEPLEPEPAPETVVPDAQEAVAEGGSTESPAAPETP